MGNPKVGIVMGSDSDLKIMQDAVKVLRDFGVESELVVASAHRTPYKALQYAESAEELVKSGIEKLQEYANANKIQINFKAEDDTYDVGDIIGAKEVITGTVATARIIKKIVTIKQGVVNIQYKVGE